MEKPDDKTPRLYYIEQYPASVGEEPELYTREDIEQVVAKSRILHPENRYVVREFEVM